MKASTAGTPLVRLEIRRRLGAVGLVIAVVALSLAGWNHVRAAGQGVASRAPLAPANLAQLAPGSEPSLTVTGYGEASAPADSALIQLLIGTAQSGFGKSMSGSSMGEFQAVVVAPSEAEVIEGTPDPSAPQQGIPVEPSGPDASRPIDEAALEPVLSALEAAGLSRDAIEIAISPLASDPYAGPYSGAARIEFTVQEPEQEMLNDLISTVSQRASAAGLSLIQVGATYRLDDCQALEDEAQLAAIDDARQRAERLAEQLGVTTGKTLLASDFGLFGGPGDGGGCSPYGDAGSYTSFGGPGGIPLTLPDFDPSRPPEVIAIKQLYLGLAIT